MNEAPVALEQKLVAAFRQHHESRRRRRVWGMGAAALAMAAALAAIAFLRMQPVKIRVPTPPTVAATVTAPKAAPPAPMAAIRKVAHRRRAVQAPQQAQQEVTTAFLPLDGSSSLPARGEVIRMDMPRSTMSMFGLPVDERRLSVPVRADVLYGEDGMAHAVRFVTTTSFETQTGR